MESPGILVIEIYTYTGVPVATEFIYIKNYKCPSSPHCKCFVDSKSFTARCDLASALVHCSQRSSTFAVSMNKYAQYVAWKAKNLKQSKSKSCLVHLNLVLHTETYSQIDSAWDSRLQLLSYKWSLLKDAAAWLSTLGGGFSALGEHSSQHAATAGNLSVKQFKLAFELGDTGLEYRCRLYYSLSMIQRGQLQQAKKIVRIIHDRAKNELRDEKLQAMCRGVWSKLQNLYKIRSEARASSSVAPNPV